MDILKFFKNKKNNNEELQKQQQIINNIKENLGSNLKKKLNLFQIIIIK